MRIGIITGDDILYNIITNTIKNHKIERFLSVENFLVSADFSRNVLLYIDLDDNTSISLKEIEDIRKNSERITIAGILCLSKYSDIDSSVTRSLSEIIIRPFHPNQILLVLDRTVKSAQSQKLDMNSLSELREYNENIENSKAKANIRTSKIDNDLEMASNLQECLYPKEFPDIRNIAVYSRFRSMEKISGDFYHFEKFSSNRFFMLFADVSGHGVTAALFSAMVKSAISSINFERSTPSEAVRKMNKFLLSVQKRPSYNYVTLCCTYFDLKKQLIAYCNAGVPSPLLINNNNQIKQLGNNGPFVGIFESADYQEEKEKFVPGNKILFFTDGAYEDAEDFNIKKGYEKIVNIANNNKTLPIKEIIDNMYNMLEKKAEKSDDSTYLGIEFIK